MNDASDVNVIVKKVEKDLVDDIVEKLKSNNLEPDKARALAKDFLSHLPPKDFNTLVNVLRELGTEYTEVNDVYVKYFGIQGDMEDARRIHAMAGHIKQGNIEKAIEVAKGGVQSG